MTETLWFSHNGQELEAEVDSRVHRRLVAEGAVQIAAPSPEGTVPPEGDQTISKPRDQMKLGELKVYAEAHGIDLGGARSAKAALAAIEAHEAKAGSPDPAAPSDEALVAAAAELGITPEGDPSEPLDREALMTAIAAAKEAGSGEGSTLAD